MPLPTLNEIDAEFALHLWYGRKLDTMQITQWLRAQKPQPNQHVPAISEAAVYNSISNLRASRESTAGSLPAVGAGARPAAPLPSRVSAPTYPDGAA